MAGQAIRTASVYKVLRSIAGMANRCDERAEEWKKKFGEDDDLRRAELVRAEAYRDAVQQIAEALDLDVAELWPVLNVEDRGR